MKLCGAVKIPSVSVSFQCHHEQAHLSKLYFFKSVFILVIYILGIEIPASILLN